MRVEAIRSDRAGSELEEIAGFWPNIEKSRADRRQPRLSRLSAGADQGSDMQKVLPASVAAANYGQYQDQREIDLYQRMLREIDFAEQRTLMRDFETYVLDTEAHEICLLWWYRIVPYRSYVKGWKISPSQLVNQDLATIWLNR